MTIMAAAIDAGYATGVVTRFCDAQGGPARSGQ